MTKLYTLALAALLISACVSKQVGLKENWIDERDVIALSTGPVSEWMLKAGRPTLVEIYGDTNVYYYNYRPTMYATTIYDTTTVFKSFGSTKEVKPGAENATEIWGSRKNTMQIKVVHDIAVSAVVTAGPDRKTLIRDLNGDFIIDPTSGYNSNISEEQKIGSSSEQFKSAYSKLYGREMLTTGASPVAGTNMSPWEYYRFKQQLDQPAVQQPTTQPTTQQPADIPPQTMPAADSAAAAAAAAFSAAIAADSAAAHSAIIHQPPYGQPNVVAPAQPQPAAGQPNVVAPAQPQPAAVQPNVVDPAQPPYGQPNVVAPAP